MKWGKPISIKFCLVLFVLVAISVIYYLFVPRMVIFNVNPADASISGLDKTLSGNSKTFLGKGEYFLKVSRADYLDADVNLNIGAWPINKIDLTLARLNSVDTIPALSQEQRLENEESPFIFSAFNNKWMVVYDARNDLIYKRDLDTDENFTVGSADFSIDEDTVMGNALLSENGDYLILSYTGKEKSGFQLINTQNGSLIYQTDEADSVIFQGNNVLFLSGNKLYALSNDLKTRVFRATAPENNEDGDCYLVGDGADAGLLVCLAKEKYYRFAENGKSFKQLTLDLPLEQAISLDKNNFFIKLSNVEKSEYFLLNGGDLTELDFSMEGDNTIQIDRDHVLTTSYNEQNQTTIFRNYSLKTGEGAVINSIEGLGPISGISVYNKNIYFETNGEIYGFKVD